MSENQHVAERGVSPQSRLDPHRAVSWRRAFAWGFRDRKTRIVFIACIALCTLFAGLVDATLINELRNNVAADVNKLFLFWGWSKFLHVGLPPALIYDPHALYAFEHGVISAHAHDLPFAYPPSLLLLIWPLAFLSPASALLLWLGVSVVSYAWACWYRPWGTLNAMLALLAPSTLAAMYYGQTSLLTAALIIGGCRLVVRRPILAGVLLGLAAFKPQFGVLVPIALVSARQWRSMMSAAATVALSVLASGVAFGWAVWIRLPAALAGLSRLVAQHARLDHISPTVTASLRMLGAGPTVIDAGQLAAAIGAGAAVWVCFRRGVTPLATAALMVGAFFVTPYAFLYDLPMATYAVLVVVIERYGSNEMFGTDEIFTLVLVVAAPGLMAYGPSQVPWGIAALTLFFALILRRIAQTARPGGGRRSPSVDWGGSVVPGVNSGEVC